MNCLVRLRASRAVLQLLWPDKDREVWFSLGENHEKAYLFDLHPLRNCFHDEKTGIFGAGSTGKAMETERSASRRAAEATEGGIYGKAFRKRFQKS
jgi:hypothetical protein